MVHMAAFSLNISSGTCTSFRGFRRTPNEEPFRKMQGADLDGVKVSIKFRHLPLSFRPDGSRGRVIFEYSSTTFGSFSARKPG